MKNIKKNGFTLAELLGVIVILAAVALIAFPPIINQIKKSRNDLDKSLNQLILTATEQYLNERNLSTNGTCYYIKLDVLISDGKLVEPIVNSKGETIATFSYFYLRYPSTNDNKIDIDEIETKLYDKQPANTEDEGCTIIYR